MWQKKGLLFDPSRFLSETIKSHAAIPYCMHVEGDLFRIFFSSRDGLGQSYPYSVDAHVGDGQISLAGNVSAPLLQLGKKGTFDDCGIMPSSLITYNGKVYMYYIGWNPQVIVPAGHRPGRERRYGKNLCSRGRGTRVRPVFHGAVF